MNNLNIRPYFDDYNEDKQFYQILFRPSYAIQARELNQLQTIIQEQVARHGRNIFKEGSMVIPGQLSIDTSLDYVKLDVSYSGLSVDTYLNSFVGDGVEIIGMSSGIKAKAILVKQTTDTTSPTIWLKYISSGDSTLTGTVKTFQPGEIIRTNDSVPLYASVKNSSDAIGVGSSANIQKGVYFVNSRFVLVKEQTILLDAYTSNPSYRVGLQVVESFITPEEDSSLYDNAQGTTNYAAPGAHRLFIDLTLTKYTISDTSDKDFIELLRIVNGGLQSNVVTTEYSVIADALARRTYDESGNYAIDAFTTSIKENRNNNRGAWQANTQYLVGDVVTSGSLSYVADTSGVSGLVAPTHIIGAVMNGGVSFRQENSPSYNQGILSPENGGDANSMSLLVDPGKAYVYGYEINKIAQSKIDIQKAIAYSGVKNATIQTDIGSYVLIENLYGVLDVTSFPTVELHDRFTVTNGVSTGSVVGTARARYIEYNSGTIGNNACQYVLSLFDIKMVGSNKFSSNVRQIYFANSSGVNFTCDTSKVLSILSGSISSATNSTTVTGVGTKFTQELKPGDAIAYYVSGTLHYTMAVSTIQSDTSLTLTANAPDALAGSAFYSISTPLYESSNDSLVFKLPSNNIRKIKDINDESTTNISYYVRQYYTGTVSAGALVISTTSSSETFASPQQPDAFHVASATNGAIIPATITLNGSGNVATITVGTGYNGSVLGVVATIKKTAKERTKSINRGFSEDITTQANAIKSIVSLSKVDGIRLLKVSEFTDNTGTPVAFGSAIPGGSIEVDITSRYIFDNGARNAFYDFCAIKNSTGIVPRSPIRVYYDYYDHSSIGDYFTVDSYEKTIPANYVDSTGKTLNLFDCIDFRPSKLSSGFVQTPIPAIGFDIIADYTYYTPRIDKIALNSSGDFVLAKGVASDTPAAPATPDNSMLMYTLLINPSVTTTPKIVITREDNRRYTMRDIGKIDNRLSNVEYYTALSLLETQTKNLQLFDNQGNISFKNGFLVDSLVDQSIADTNSNEFLCSIDVAEGSLRPSFSLDNVNLIEKAATDTDRNSLGYVVNNGIVTLPYTTTVAIEQPFASKIESVTPYIKINFIGDVNLRPSSDEWYETSYKPDIVVSQEGNFSAVANNFKSQLGTVWNAWQTTWTGTSNALNFRNAVRTTTTNQTRTGTNTYVKAVYDTAIIGDRIVSIDIIPFIRARLITFQGHGLKPNSRMYAYFDGTNVTSYITPAKKISLTGKTGAFDSQTSAGVGSDSTARSISSLNDGVSSGLSVGDVIHNGTGGNISLATATAIVLLDEDDCVRVVNQRGTFTVGQTVYGSISGVSASITSIESSPSLVSNSYGEIAGAFNIPSNSQLRFRTGNRNFILTDSPTNGPDATSSAITVYSATGYMQNRQRTILSTRNGVLAKEAVSQNQTITTNIVIDYNPDPLAESFKIPAGDGMFIDSVDVFFAGKDRSLPVTFELREMFNGLPTQTVLPGSRVTLKPSNVTTSTNASIATNIKMQYPVFVDGDTEYCFVLASDSPYYSVWVSNLGEVDVLYGQRIAKQPYLGTLFKSQNASTWNADQFEDIKFRINRCVFNTNVAGNVKFANQRLDSITLNSNSIFTKSGSSYIRVFVPNHGIPIGSNISISGLTTNVNGITATQINGSKPVIAIERDFVVLNTTGTATSTGYSNFTDTVFANRHVSFDLVNLISSQIQFKNTSLNHFLRALDTNYSMSTTAIELIPNENTQLSSTRMIASNANEATFNSGYKSVEVIAQLQSNSQYLSPVIDLDRYSLICVGNRIGTNPTTKNFVGLDDVSTSLSVTFSSAANTITAGTTGAFGYLKNGQQITISGATNATNNGTYTILSIDDSTSTILTTTDTTFINETATVTIVSYNKWFDEISEYGTTSAKYIMKPLILTNPATALKILFDVNFVSPSSFAVYYRTSPNGTPIVSGKTWILANPVSTPTYNTTNTLYSTVEYDILSSVPFNAAQIKIVMLSSDSTKVPTIKQIRLIATS